MADVLVGVIVLVLGLTVCFAGLQVFMVTLPIWGFIAGFFVGAAGWEALVGDGLLRTVTGWLIGLGVGLVFALFSYFFWYAGAIIAAGSTGALAGSGLMAAFNVGTDWIVFIVAFACALLFALIAMLIALPAYVVLVNTSFVGAMAAVTGVMLILNRVDIEDLGHGTAWAMVNESWFWLLAWAAVAVMGIVTQMRLLSELSLPDDRWARAQAMPQV